MTDNDGRETLRQAAEWLSEHNWVQGGLYERDSGGTVDVGNALPADRTEVTGACATGAIAAVCGFKTSSNSAWKAAIDRLGALIGGNLIPDWNDRTERTKEDVILAMKKAAEL